MDDPPGLWATDDPGKITITDLVSCISHLLPVSETRVLVYARSPASAMQHGPWLLLLSASAVELLVQLLLTTMCLHIQDWRRYCPGLERAHKQLEEAGKTPSRLLVRKRRLFQQDCPRHLIMVLAWSFKLTP